MYPKTAVTGVRTSSDATAGHANSLNQICPAGHAPAPSSSWDELVRHHQRVVFRHAYRLTGSRLDAEDLTQDTFMRAFPHLLAPRTGTLEGWLYRITHNLFLDRLRREQLLSFVPLSEDDPHPAGVGADPATVAADGWLDADLSQALNRLPRPVREALLLHDVYGYTCAEIASRHGVARGTVASRLSRGRAHLRRALAEPELPRTDLAA